VLRRKFDPEATLAAVDEHDATALVAVPIMLQRILELDEEVRRRYDLSSLRVVASSGGALDAELSERWMDELGDNLYNLYGLTEVAWAAIATPEDLRAAPGTSGPPRPGRRSGSSTRMITACPPGRPGRSTSATRCSWRSTRAARARKPWMAICRPATSATSTRRAGCSWRAAPTT
jgi:acyl-coenzyme A synthetase/AMP-(fatty) acid ligase